MSSLRRKLSFYHIEPIFTLLFLLSLVTSMNVILHLLLLPKEICDEDGERGLVFILLLNFNRRMEKGNGSRRTMNVVTIVKRFNFFCSRYYY